MDSDLHQYSHDRQQQQQQQPMNTSRLMRYRSAPSSYFAALSGGGGGGENCDEFLNPRPPSPETERILARFISSGGTVDSSSHSLCDVRQSASETLQPQFGTTMKHETDLFHHQEEEEEEDHQQQQHNIGFSSASQMPFQNQSLPSLPNPNSGMDSSYRVMGSTPMEHLIRGGGNSNLIRHSSSPAGLFSHINIENGYGVMRGMGSFGGTNAEESFPSPSRLKGPMDFSSEPPSSSGRTNLISENRSKSMEMGGPEDGSFAESHRNDRGYMAGFPIGSWDDSTLLSDSSFLNDDRKTFSGMSASENQNAEGGNRPTTMLSHHLSLPKSSAELSAILQFQDSVPCKIRAKRGCATHPRSIAERVRRTRISERMRKLQELVPNMDKQTNTADMLDLAVDYIKDLQKQVKTLADQRAKCTCSDNQRS